MQFTDVWATILRHSPKLVVGALIIFGSWLLAVAVGRLILRLGAKAGVSRKEVVRLGAITSKTGVIVLGVLTGLGTMGINVSALVAGLGLTGFALGFAMRDALSNLLAGVLLVLYQPFKLGDWVAVGAFEGHTVEINLRYTVLEKETDVFLMPNSILLTNTIRLSRQA